VTTQSEVDATPPAQDGPGADPRVRQLLALNKAAIEITAELDLDNLLQRIVDVARELVGCRYAALGVLGEDGYIVRFPTSGISREEREKIGAPPRGHGLLGVMLRAGRSLRIPDISADPRRAGFPPHHPPMRSLLGVPIFVRGRLMGDLYLTEKIGAPEFSDEDEWLVQLLATHAATALTNAQLHRENMQAVENLRALQDAVKRVASHLDFLSVTDELLRYAVQLTNSDLAWLGMLDEHQQVRPAAVLGDDAAGSFKQELRIDLRDPALNNGPSGRAMRTLKPQTAPDLQDDATVGPWEALTARYRLRSAAAVPLIYQGQAVGVLSLYARRAAAFEDIDMALLVVMADHAAVALQNAVHYQEVNQARARSQALLKVTQAINQSVDLDTVIELIVQSAIELLGAAGAAVFLLAEPGPAGEAAAGGWITAHSAVGVEDSFTQQIGELPMQQSVAGRAILTRETQIVGDTLAVSDIVFPRLSGGDELRSLVVVPLRVGDEMLGVLSTYAARPHAFNPNAVQLLEAFGAQASTALYNARLYQEAQRGREAAESEQQRLRELEQMKDEFLSTAAHELRTPLTTIRMSAGLAYEQLRMLTAEPGAGPDGGLDPRLANLVGLVLEGSERMHSLVNDLLDLTRLEQGRTQLIIEDLDMREVINASLEVTRPLFSSKNQKISFHMPEARYMVRGDRPHLEQVLINLLSNAHKYSPEGSQVDVRLTRSGGECLVMVRDQGPGVPEDERERIFERFYRSSLHRQDRTPSTGLGLPIARTITEMHRGRLWVEPAPGGGSIFTLALPIAA
jgi:signal transduction histidine kinase